MKFILYISICLIALPAWAQKGVRFVNFTMADLDDQAAISESNTLVKDSAKTAFFEHYRVYDDDILHAWGLDLQDCKDFHETDDLAYHGATCLSFTWDQSLCPWMGWGTAWIGGKAMNFKGYEKTAALRFYIRSQQGTTPVPVIKVALEDGNQTNSYVEVGYRYFKGQALSTTWEPVIIPLAAFGMAGKGMDLTQIQQMIMSFDGKGSIYADQFEIIEYSGSADNPFGKSREEIYPTLQANPIDLPYVLFDDDQPGAGWGFGEDAIKQVAINGGKIDWRWNYGNGEGWVGWGFALNDVQRLDMSGVVGKAALTFTIDQITPKSTEIPEISIGFEDIYARSSYVELDARYIQKDLYSGVHQVVIPLTDFRFESTGMLAANIKQLICYANWNEKNQHHVTIDDMAITAYDGPPSNPFDKERYDLFIAEDDVLSESDPSTEGAFVGGFLTNDPLGTGKAFSLLTGRKPACVMWYSDWSEEVDTEVLQSIIDQGHTPHMVWEAMLDMESRSGVTLDDILSGKFDPYIERSAKAIQALTGTLQIRIFHEFNGGTWYPWSPKVNGKELGAEKMIAAWRHVHDIFEKKVGTDNVEWVFCFYKMDRVDGDVQHAEWNQPLAAYPGDDYVDWVGVDFYNYFPKYDEVWKDFKEQFAEQYLYMAENFPNKPIQISEFASNTKGGNKGQWFKDMNRDIQSLFPRLKLYNYFEINKEADWRLASTPESQKAFQEIMKDPYNRSSYIGLNNVCDEYPQWVKTLEHQDIQAVKAYLTELDSLKKMNFSKFVDHKQTAQATQVGAIQIDGQINSEEWPNAAIAIGDAAKFHVQFNDSALYISGFVLDESPLQNGQEGGNVWNGDAIEIAFSLDHRADPYRSHLGDHDVHLALKASDEPYLWSWKLNQKLSDAQVAVSQTKTGYSFEMMIPYSAIGMLSWKSGKTYDFELAIDLGTRKGRQQQIRWNNNQEDTFYKHPYLWGEIETIR